MAAGYAFRPRGWALLAAGLACAAGIALGNWQSRRADEKRALGALERVALEGEFAPKHAVYLSRPRRGQLGFEVVMPLRRKDSGAYVLVKRGWIGTAAGGVPPPVATPAGAVRIEGIALPRIERVLAVGEESGRVRQNLDVAAYAKETGLPLEPRVIEQHSDTGDGLARDWPPHDAGVEKHEGYALQWYSLAALAFVLGMVFSFRKSEAAPK